MKTFVSLLITLNIAFCVLNTVAFLLELYFGYSQFLPISALGSVSAFIGAKVGYSTYQTLKE